MVNLVREMNGAHPERARQLNHQPDQRADNGSQGQSHHAQAAAQGDGSYEDDEAIGHTRNLGQHEAAMGLQQTSAPSGEAKKGHRWRHGRQELRSSLGCRF